VSRSTGRAVSRSPGHVYRCDLRLQTEHVERGFRRDAEHRGEADAAQSSPSGYLIAKIIDDGIGPYARASHGRIYPLLADLERKEQVISEVRTTTRKTGERQARWYSITDEGKKRFHRLMMDTASNPGEYQKICAQKVQGFPFLKPTERLYLLDHYSNFCQAHILHINQEREDFKRDIETYAEFRPTDPEATLSIMQHAIDQWSLELAWAQQLRAREIMRQEELSLPGGQTTML
jgi:DNA-binding PadR family transcriptional regulator